MAETLKHDRKPGQMVGVADMLPLTHKNPNAQEPVHSGEERPEILPKVPAGHDEQEELPDADQLPGAHS